MSAANPSATQTDANPIAAIAAQAGFMIVDGALATELERLGCDLNDALWSARVLREAPERIRDVHRTYFEAGADVAITASYQATREGFMRAGLEATEADALIQRAVTLAKEARDACWAAHAEASRPYPLVAASVGPYGAFLADGSEYRGDYAIGRAALAEFHRPRLRTLLEAGPDLLAVETLPSLEEALAVAGLLPDLSAVPAWFTFSARDEGHISDGTPIERCGEALEALPGVAAIGINCTALAHIESLVTRLRGVTRLPIIVYPNSGEHYDPVTKTWHAGCAHAPAPRDLAEGLPRWLAAGASAIGGCCRTGPEDIEALARARRAQI
ncbi:homocysteine S-methyltransferase [Salinicola sp. DM10]|uniref:homocysteine S-methyltransferase n=1 Tax=Salinicola sp. DM10 TaxID=2815721 RepID=UPI001A8DDA81|nr:homocysteine S-methyltransferase [Salinicola sp. DM10]MCE3027381.1 homocysteine S-methyltransferase [Salinicola sp. DM10]